MEKIQIFLGINGDQSVCHNYTMTPGNYIGQIVAGPYKLLELLELHLGLSGIFQTETARVLLLKEKFSTLPQKAFPFAAAFKHDPLGVSKRLLTLWDSWRIAGWEPGNAGLLPKRMQQLLDLKMEFTNIGAGTVERIAAVIKALENQGLPNICIHLIDPIESYPYLVQRLLNKLADKSTFTTEVFLPQASPQTDLGKLQILLNGGDIDGSYANDQTLQIISFPNDILAANAVYSIQQADNWNPLIVNTDNSLLNGFQFSYNKPVCNWQTIAGNGQLSQLFFLATALFKRPVNSSQVLAFLAAPVTPFSKKLSRKLLGLFAEKPGLANEKWKASITDYLVEINGQQGELAKKKEVKFWLQNNMLLQEPNLEIQLLTEIFSMLESWSTKTAYVPYYKLYSDQLLNLSSLCRQLVTSLLQEGATITSAKFERLQSELFSDIPSTIAEAQVGCSNIVDTPGAIWNNAEEILWMNAVRFESSNYLSKYWYQEEKDFFKKQELPIPDESHENIIYEAGLKRMVLCGKKRLVVIVPEKISGVVASKPFCLDEWDKMLSLKPITIEAHDLLDHIPWKPGISIIKEYPAISLPKASKYLSIKGSEFTREKESFSSLEKLFQHPAQWFLEYKLKIRCKPGIMLPPEQLLKGTIADSVVQIIFSEENRLLDWWKPQDRFIQQVELVFQQCLLKEGLPFLENKSKRFLHAYKNSLTASLCQLRNFIDSNDFVIKGTQSVVKGNIGNTPFEGFIDMLLSKNGKDCIIDLKWAGSSKKYIEKIVNGTDLQLALYQVMEPDAERAGFFLFNDGKMYMRDQSVNGNLKSVTLVNATEGVSAKNTYEQAVNSLQFRREELGKGKAETAYDLDLEEIDYYNQQSTKKLYPLSEKDMCKQAPYQNDFNLIFGKIS